MRSGLQLTCVDFRPRIGRIHYEGDHGDIGYHLAQQLESLGGELVEKQSYACSVAFRPTDTGDDADLDRIATSEEDDGKVEVADLAACAEAFETGE